MFLPAPSNFQNIRLKTHFNVFSFSYSDAKISQSSYIKLISIGWSGHKMHIHTVLSCSSAHCLNFRISLVWDHEIKVLESKRNFAKCFFDSLLSLILKHMVVMSKNVNFIKKKLYTKHSIFFYLYCIPWYKDQGNTAHISHFQYCN